MVALLVMGAHAFSLQAIAQSKIEQLTTQKTADEMADSLPGTVSQSAPTYDSGINVHSLGLGVGQTFVNGEFAQDGEDKITWDLLYNYSASHSFDFLANFHSSKHTQNGHFVRLTGLALGIKGKLYQFDNFAPFIVGGFGFYNPKVKRDVAGQLQESESKMTFGVHLGAGAELKLNRHFSVGVLGHLHNPFDVKQDLGPEVEGSYFKLLITSLYSF